MKSLSELVTIAEQFEPLPPTAARLARVIASEKSSIDEVVGVVRFDQALAAGVLRLANSAFSAANRSITDIKQAIIRIGGGRILEMLVAKQVKGVMQQPLVQYGYTEEDLWRHSVASAVAAECLARFATVNIPGAAFTAALLHDFGKLIMVRVFGVDEMSPIWKTMNEKNVSWAVAEKELFGFTHADVGGLIAQVWHLPESIELAIRFHHTMDTALDPITDSVRTANVVARAIGQGVGDEGMSVLVDSDIATRLGVSRERFEALCAAASLRVQEVLAFYEQ